MFTAVALRRMAELCVSERSIHDAMEEAMRWWSEDDGPSLAAAVEVLMDRANELAGLAEGVLDSGCLTDVPTSAEDSMTGEPGGENESGSGDELWTEPDPTYAESEREAEAGE